MAALVSIREVGHEADKGTAFEEWQRILNAFSSTDRRATI